jgi:hypothetical protein
MRISSSEFLEFLLKFIEFISAWISGSHSGYYKECYGPRCSLVDVYRYFGET